MRVDLNMMMVSPNNINEEKDSLWLIIIAKLKYIKVKSWGAIFRVDSSTGTVEGHWALITRRFG